MGIREKEESSNGSERLFTNEKKVLTSGFNSLLFSVCVRMRVWLSHLHDVVSVKVGSAHHQAREHEGKAQTHAPAPCPRWPTHCHPRLRVLWEAHTQEVSKSTLGSLPGFPRVLSSGPCDAVPLGSR